MEKSTVPLLSCQGFGGCDCGGGEVVVVGVEAVSPRGVVDRRVLTADVDASLGLITCEGVDSARWPNSISPRGVTQVGVLIPVIGSAVGAEGGGVEHNDGIGSSSSRSGR